MWGRSVILIPSSLKWIADLTMVLDIALSVGGVGLSRPVIGLVQFKINRIWATNNKARITGDVRIKITRQSLNGSNLHAA